MTSRHLVLTTTLLLLCAVAAAEDTPDASSPPPSGALLLRNGHLIEGTILRLGDRYRVTLPHGEITIRADQVAEEAVDSAAIYERLGQALADDDLKGHVQLADWCLAQRLPGYAARELRHVMALAPGDVRVEWLALRVAQARRGGVTREKKVVPAADRTAGAEEDDQSEPRRVLSAAALATFARPVQPMLLNRCATTACHGSRTTTSFRLVRSRRARAMPRRTTERNLTQTVEWIDAAAPDASRLLEYARSKHGSERSGTFLARDTKGYQLLERWVLEMGPAPPSALSEDAVAVTGRDTSIGDLFRTSPATTRPAPRRDLPPGDDPSETAGENSSYQLHEPRRLIVPQSPPPALVNETDPDVFNRRFFPDRSGKASPAPRPR